MLNFLTILLFTVVIDAGHGGKDPGAVGKRYQEKDINLNVSLALGEEIKKNYPDVKVVFTRSDDRFLPLQERADIVNRNKADLFICIHTNSAESKQSAGAETFVLGTEKMNANLDVAMRENAVIQLEDDYNTTYQGFDPNSIESYIMFELMQNQYIDQSLQFASLLQHQFADNLKRADRGVRQAAFWVLLKSACPSVLVELGFISNAEEEKYLGSKNGQKELTGALLHSFESYYNKVNRKVVPVKPTETPKQTTAPKEEKAKQSTKEEKKKPAVAKEEKNKAKPAVAKEEKWAVQILTSKTKLDKKDPRLKGEKAQYFQKDGLYKYYTGECSSRDEAKLKQQELKGRFVGCFVIKL